MKDAEGVEFLQWCLPRLRLRWPGFRKVRRQVYKRIDRRLRELECGIDQYRSYLEQNPAEWAVLDSLCWISISRFYRDRRVFQFLQQVVLDELARMVVARGGSELRVWSLGCASGEEPYTLSILWKQIATRFAPLRLRILATDVDEGAIQRARRGCYAESSLRELPSDWRAQAFVASEEGFCLKPEYREPVMFLVQDVRKTTPAELFELILCRNVIFTYFDDDVQRAMCRKLLDRLLPGGALVIGNLESLPQGVMGLEPWAPQLGIYRYPPRA